ncbi:MAG: hypothetical protein KAW87_05845, partial [Candidatus Cloacimonetes bacterium]|nr:hypothetical protein [Candidatus Cloacimonadota bacterium]
MRNKFIVVLILSILIFNSVLAKSNISEIKYMKTTKEFSIYNSKASKIIKYFLILPEEEIKIRTVNIDSLRIYSRLIFEENDKLNYKYLIIINNEERIIKKSTRVSTLSKGLHSEKISSFNKYLCKLDGNTNDIIIKNLSIQKLLIKIRGNTIKSKDTQIEFVAFSPQFYQDDKVLIIDEKEYTYYTPKSGEIKLILEGPVLLKIISRLVFGNHITKKYNYRFELYDNAELITTFQEEANKSAKAIFADYQNRTPSKGDVNIIKFSEGLHNIIIKDSDQNR